MSYFSKFYKLATNSSGIRSDCVVFFAKIKTLFLTEEGVFYYGVQKSARVNGLY